MCVRVCAGKQTLSFSQLSRSKGPPKERRPLRARIARNTRPRSVTIGGDVPPKGFIKALRGKNADDRLGLFRRGLTRIVTRALFELKQNFCLLCQCYFLFFRSFSFFFEAMKRCLVCNVDILRACITADRMIHT